MLISMVRNPLTGRDLAAAKDEGYLAAVERFQESLVRSVAERASLRPKIADAIERVVDSHDYRPLQQLVPVYNLLLKEEKQLLDRLIGPPVQSTKAEVTNTNVNVNIGLREFMVQERAALDASQARAQALLDAGSPIEGEVVSAEEVPGDAPG